MAGDQHSSRVIRIGGSLYMAGLFWQVADSDSRLRAEAIEAARDIAGEVRYKYCVTRPEPVPQFGLATAAAGFRFALNAAAPVLASQLNGNWIGLFEVETTSGDLAYWVAAVRNDAIQADIDTVYDTLDEARQDVVRHMQDGGLDKVLSNIDGLTGLGHVLPTHVEQLMRGVGGFRLLPLGNPFTVFQAWGSERLADYREGRRTLAPLIFLVLLVVCGGGGGLYWYFDAQEQERLAIEAQQKARLAQLRARRPPMPWNDAALPSWWIQNCAVRLNRIYSAILGWEIRGWQCHEASAKASLELVRTTGDAKAIYDYFKGRFPDADVEFREGGNRAIINVALYPGGRLHKRDAQSPVSRGALYPLVWATGQLLEGTAKITEPSRYAPPPAAVGPNEIPPLPAPPKSTVDLETKYPLLTADQSVARMIDQVPTFTIESLAFFDGRYRLMGAVYEQK